MNNNTITIVISKVSQTNDFIVSYVAETGVFLLVNCTWLYLIVTNTFNSDKTNRKKTEAGKTVEALLHTEVCL